MRAQVSLTPTESKKFLAKALAQMPLIKAAAKEGLVVIHPSSTTLFLIEELIGKRPKGLWVCGMIVPAGTCFSRERRNQVKQEQAAAVKKVRDPGNFPFSWVIERGSFKTGLPLSGLLEKMGRDDVYVKGVNAIDPKGKAGVLYAHTAAGTIAKAIQASRKKRFTIMLPVGFEKLIPTPIATAVQSARLNRIDTAMGAPVGLIPVSGKVVTEVDAVGIISGAEAVVVAAGGLGGAEGSVTMIIKGTPTKVDRALNILREVKGAKLPRVHPTECNACPYTICHLNVNFK